MTNISKILRKNGELEETVLSALKDQYEEADIREALLEVLELKDAGLLYTEDIYEKYRR